MLFGVEVEVILPVLLLADAALHVRLGGLQVGLHHVQGQAVEAGDEGIQVRHFDQVFALFGGVLLLADDPVDFL